jgi:hypothetical protein
LAGVVEIVGKAEAEAGAGAEVTVAGHTWKPTTAGILGIIAGVLGVVIGITIVVLGTTAGGLLVVIGLPGLGRLAAGAAAIPLVLGIVAIVGGIFALRRRIWGLALAGSICAFIVGLAGIWPAIFLGIPAIVFTCLGKREFE